MKLHTLSFVLMSLLASSSLLSLSGCEKSETVVDANKNTVDTNRDVIDDDQRMNDMRLAQKVNQAIANEEFLGEFKITVVATDGVVRLAGEVNTLADHDRLINIVSGVEGVNSIDDRLTTRE